MQTQTVRLAIMAPTLNLCNYQFGIDQGFFRREGLEVEVIVRPGSRNTEALLDGEADFAAASECVIEAALRGPTDMRIVLQVLNDPLHHLVVQRDIRKLDDLRGKRIAVPAAGSTPEMQTKLYLRKNGLIPGEDIEVVCQSPGETMEDRIRSFEDGRYAALIASPPAPLRLQAAGYGILTELSEHFPGTASHGLIAMTGMIESRPQLVEAVVRGYVRGVTALKTDRDQAIPYIAKRYRLDDDLAARCYELMRGRWTAALSLDSLRTECEFHARNAGAKPIAPEAVADARFVRLTACRD